MWFFGRPDIQKLADAKDTAGLVKALRHKDLDVKWNAILALRCIGDPRQWDEVTKVLALQHPAESLELLRQTAKGHADWRIRRDAVVLAADIPLVAAEEVAVSALRDERHDVRLFAALVIAGWPGQVPRWKGKDLVDPLIALLQDKAWAVRKAAAEALGRLKHSEAVEPLLVALSDSESEVRRAVAMALGEIGDSRAIPALTEALATWPAHEQSAARGGLSKLRS